MVEDMGVLAFVASWSWQNRSGAEECKVQHARATYIAPKDYHKILGDKKDSCASVVSLHIGNTPCNTLELLIE